MSDTTCNYNKVHGSFHRRELKMLAQAIGLPEERMEQRLNRCGVGETIATSELLLLIENGTFWTDFYRVYNNRSGRYNSQVLAKALRLIDAHLFSFEEIFKARLGFDLYEMNSLRNDMDLVRLMFQTIRFCDYQISLLKLKQRLRHYNLSHSRVLHLCEYFDLLLNCTREGNRSDPAQKKSIDLIDPKPVDEQLMAELNRKYLHDERNWYFQEKFCKGKLVESSVWPAKLLHEYQTNEAAIRKAQLQRQVSASVLSLKQSRAGSACSSPAHVSALSKTSERRLHDRSLILGLQRSRPASTCSFRSFTPTAERSSSACSSSPSTSSSLPDVNTKSTEISQRLEELRSESAFLRAKYDVHREDYMSELFPDGCIKPIIVTKPITPRRTRKPYTPFYWLRRAVPK